MGEATYYLKARFNSAGELSSKMGEIKDFFEQGCNAEDYWQTNRDKKPSEFWPTFKQEFPLIVEYLGDKFVGGDCNNDLAGVLNFGSEEDVDHALRHEGAILYYSAYTWHFANWDKIANFLEKYFGAVATNWLSDEHLNPFDCLAI